MAQAEAVITIGVDRYPQCKECAVALEVAQNLADSNTALNIVRVAQCLNSSPADASTVIFLVGMTTSPGHDFLGRLEAQASVPTCPGRAQELQEAFLH